MKLLLLTANVRRGKVRRETLNGRVHVVANAVLIVPGVLPGSQGDLFYPHDEIAANFSDWDGTPLVVRHPVRNGRHISARSPDVMRTVWVGYVFSSRLTDAGKLAGETWVDEAAADRIAANDAAFAASWAKYKAGEPIELSTGLKVKTQPKSGVYNGRRYAAIARAYRPDHLAILPDEVGACSVKDGCGLNVENAFCPTGEGGGRDNSCSSAGGGGKSPMSARDDVRAALESGKVSENDFDKWNTGAQKARDGDYGVGARVAIDKDYGGGRGYVVGFDSDGSFATVKQGGKINTFHNSNLKRVGNAAPGQPQSKNTGRWKKIGSGTGKGEVHAAAQAGHYGPAPDEDEDHEDCCAGKAEGERCDACKTAADQNPEGDVTNKETEMKKTEMIAFLVANCACWKGQEKLLGGMDEQLLKGFVDDAKASVANAGIAQAVKAGAGIEGDLTADVVNAFFEKKGKGGKKMPPKDAAEEEEDEEEEEEAAVGNRRQQVHAPRPSTFKELLDLAPPQFKENLQVLNENIEASKARCIGVIVANMGLDGDEAKEAAKDLSQWTLKKLQKRAVKVANRRGPDDDDDDEVSDILNFAGAQGAPASRQPKEQEGLSTAGHRLVDNAAQTAAKKKQTA